ncbi:TPA: hypothetical protein DDW35_06270 [Candidatus Sumerlaeota bacterium]|jgi:hypothetical protein|nr:hypothetical protein [Candidatus Sumerlaeota bacterium]
MFIFTLSTRTLIFLLSLVLTAALGLAAFSLSGLAGFVLFTKKAFPVNSTYLFFWPKSWPSYTIPVEYGWYYIYVALGILFILIPALLALLEHIYFMPRYKNEQNPYLGI